MKRKQLLLLFALLMTAATGAWAQSATTTYKVDLNDGTQNPATWQGKAGDATDFGNLPLQGVAEGQAVTLKYNGRLKVKNVTATYAVPWDGDLSKLTAESTAEFATATDGMTIKGALAEGVNVKVSIADEATVTLDGVTINGVSNKSYQWAGINCLGDATIILSGTNTVKGFHQFYPGIYVPVDMTLTIQGSGSLTASSNGVGCGIGGGNLIACGNIVIADGTITANGGTGAAGIGGGRQSSCGTISITGGTVNATGGEYAAGIGSGQGDGGGGGGLCGNISITGGTVTANGGEFAAGIGSGAGGSCGTVTITNGVTSVTATMGEDGQHSIGAGSPGSCGTVTIGGTKYWENNAAVGDGATYLAQATIVYPAEEPVTLATPLTIEAITPGTIKVNMSGTLTTGMKYSVNGGTPTLITTTTSIGGLKVGDKVQFYGNVTDTQAYGDDIEVKILGSGAGFQTKVYGNIMSLLDEEGFATKTDLPNAEYVFYGLFWDNTTLIDASELLLPATTLAYGCYQQMFYGCANLTTAPKLPATTLASSCYKQMFNGCINLTSAYVKAAYTADGKFSNMFTGCSATGAVLHTTSDNKASWEAKMGTGKTWETWSVADDWQE